MSPPIRSTRTGAHSIRGTAIEGYSALRSSKYYLMDLMNSLYDSNYDICPYELTVEPGFGSTLQSDTFTTSSAKYFISVISYSISPSTSTAPK